ncbi:MAG: DNA-directed RNA polymerase subunit alpha [Patescibacteria group bacterium]
MSSKLTLPVYPPIKSRLDQIGDNHFRVEIEPLVPGFGHTFGNSLRRILLSSIPGYGVTFIRINDLTHEFQPIEGIKEDAIDVVLNLKALRAKINTDEQKATLTLKTAKTGKVYAKDFKKDSRVDISNPDLYICELDGTRDLEIEVDLEKGIGYRSNDDIETLESPNPMNIAVDTLFSPVSNVSLMIDQTRVGDKTNYDKLVLEFNTDGTVEPKTVVDYALELIIDTYQKILSSFGVISTSTEVVSKPDITDSQDSDDSLASSDLSKRLVQILKKNDVSSVDDLKKYESEGRLDEIFEFAGMSEKYIQEIKDYLAKIA